MARRRVFAIGLMLVACSPSAGVGSAPQDAAIDAMVPDRVTPDDRDASPPHDTATSPDLPSSTDAPSTDAPAVDAVPSPDVVPPPDVVSTPDAIAPPDVVTAPDVIAPPDVVTVPDGVTVPDVASPPDAPPPLDVASPPDTGARPDVVSVPDIVAPPDVAPPADTGAAQVCTPGASECVDARTRRVCTPEGSGTTDLPCAVGTTCRAGTCVTQSCTPGTAACASPTTRSVCDSDGLGATTTACSGAASASPTCSGGVCGFTCNAGYGDCDGAVETGCETAILTSAQHCGACGRSCPGRGVANTTVACAGGACSFSCGSGFANCDSDEANGCEAALQTDAGNCGACGRACTPGLRCTAGECVVAYSIPDLPGGRASFGVARDTAGRVYAIGGETASVYRSNLVQVWDPNTSAWATRAPLPIEVWSPSAVATADGRVWCFGGEVSFGVVTGRSFVYNPEVNTWTEIATMFPARASMGIALAQDGSIYLIGGINGTSSNAVTSYDPVAGSYRSRPSLLSSLHGLRAATASDGRIWTFGGVNTTTNVAYSLVYVFDPVRQAWGAGPALPYPHYGMGVVAARNGLIYLASGGIDATTRDNRMWSFDPAALTYTLRANYPLAVVDPGLVQLLDGRIVGVGGRIGAGPMRDAYEYLISTNLWR